MKKTKKEKRAQKQEKRTRALVKEAFHVENVKSKNNPMVESLVKSVMLNKAVIKKDRKRQQAWDEEYYQKLFVDFKRLIKEHNERLETKTDKLVDRLNSLKSEVKKYEEKLKKFEEIDKLLKENA